MERLTKMEDDSIYNMSQNRGYSVPPPLPITCNAEPSELYRIVLRHSHYPPILQANSWTLAVPFKEILLHRTPTESIGSHYSPQAQDLKINKLKHRQRTLRQSLAKPARLPAIPPGRKLPIKGSRRDTSPQASLSPQPKPGSSNICTPSSRPMSPKEQLDIMCSQEEKMKAKQREPNEKDL
ncbi:dynein axonemal heavy chain 3-like, partial [Acanthopagrus schlegelii]